MTRNQAFLLLHICVFAWGFTAILGELITYDSVSLVWWRLLVVNLSLLVYLVIARKKLILNKSIFWKIAGVGAIVGIHWLCFFGGIKVANISITMISFSTGTFFTALIEPWVYKRKINPNEVIIGVLIMLIISIIGLTEFENSENPIWGIVLGSLAALTAAIFSTFNGKLIQKSNSFTISFVELIFAFILVSIGLLLFFEVPDNLFSPSTEDIWYILLLGIGCTAFPFIASVEVMKKLSPFSVNLAVNLEIVYAIILGYFIFGTKEQMTPTFYICGAMIGVLIVFNEVLKRKRKKRKANETIIDDLELK
ncbi:DMT family transporter [Flavobacteriales bacterium]|jgi:drug/metabolite transporter (DMT)-like permease|nr:DMT family transporter [Flavobacteriales bacterium]MDB4052315.1 DMT family transporter [Flavobacteriales bacterium]MDB4195995.1 DMT family transporter [Flavobacteriales bacterium]MDB9931728.1 DMT family transporter [Flavobacteriales bacterium]MDC1370390.1 DMT family transporter [Flavobacteriales bacterium]|tara:strand:- start:1342 stop:2268 length:927 start_codon:yes stop_codon:yes gene_type:complete